MEQNRFAVQFTNKAREDLESIVEYIAELDPIAAVNFVSIVEEVIDNLSVFPEIGTLLDNEMVFKKNIRKIVIDHYLLYYLPDIEQKEITVLSIIYGKRSTEEIARQLNM